MYIYICGPLYMCSKGWLFLNTQTSTLIHNWDNESGPIRLLVLFHHSRTIQSSEVLYNPVMWWWRHHYECFVSIRQELSHHLFNRRLSMLRINMFSQRAPKYGLDPDCSITIPITLTHDPRMYLGGRSINITKWFDSSRSITNNVVSFDLLNRLYCLWIPDLSGCLKQITSDWAQMKLLPNAADHWELMEIRGIRETVICDPIN